MPLISIIVPVFKTEKFLKKCLDTIVNQTLTDIEIICVNDGSPDNSLEILNEYASKDKRIKVISQENSGPSVARNTGIAVATGEYIGFVDSDDWIDLDFYEKLYTAAKKYDADIAVCGIKRIKGNKQKLFMTIKKEKFTVDRDEKFKIGDIPKKNYVWNKIYKFKLFREHNLQFEAGMYYEDIYFSSQIFLYARSVVTVPKISYNYMVNSGSIVGSKNTLKEEHFRDNNEKTMRFLEANNVNINSIVNHVERYKIFGLTLLKTVTYKCKKDYLLFNIIKFSHERY